jgi:hypothetical protein
MSAPTPAGPAPRDGHVPPGGASPAGGPQAAATPRGAARTVSWGVAAVTFVIGLVLGAVGTGLGGGDDDATGSPTGTPATTAPQADPSPTPGGDVTIPGACLVVADRAEQLSGLVRDAAVAAGELDAAALSGIVRQLEEAQAGLQAQSAECRAGRDATG